MMGTSDGNGEDEMKSLKPALIRELRNKFGDTVRSADLQAYGYSVIAAVRSGALPKISKGVYSLKGLDHQAANDPIPQAKVDPDHIRARFAALDMLTEGVIAGHVRSLIVAGAPGVGKTYTLEQQLNAAERNRKIASQVEVKGSISAIGLFLTLWENRDKGQVIVLDDIDSVFSDEECMNLLKGALDSSDRRVISWIKDSSFLRDRDIPNSFEYKGQVVFITNVDIESVIERGTKMAPHMNALLSRAVFLDLAIHTPEAVMIRIEQIVAETDFITKQGITTSQAVQIMDWLRANMTQLRTLSLRTVIQLAAFVKTTSNWKQLAEATLNRNR